MTQLIEIKEDLHQPTRIVSLMKRTRALHQQDETFNAYVLRARETQNRRTLIRVGFEVYARAGKTVSGSPHYCRLRGKHVVLDLPNAAQAELAIELIRKVVKSLDGQWLASE